MITINGVSVAPIIDTVTVVVNGQEWLNTVNDPGPENDGEVENSIHSNKPQDDSSDKSVNDVLPQMEPWKLAYGEHKLIPMKGVMLAEILHNMDTERKESPYHQKIHFEPTPLKTSDLRNLEINSFEQSHDLPLETQSLSKNLSFVSALDKMAEDMDESLRESNERIKMSTEVAIGATMSISAGFVSWVLRAGSLMASFMSVIPMWKQFDPLPILGAAKVNKDKDEAVKELSEDKSDAKVEEIFSQKRSD
jgi:hypothetical protein